MVQGSQFSVILNKLLPSALFSAHFPNALPTQRLDNLRVTYQAQVTFRGLSYKAVSFFSATLPGETFHCYKRFAVVCEEVPDEGLFGK